MTFRQTAASWGCRHLVISALVLLSACAKPESEVSRDKSVLVDRHKSPEERAAAAKRLRLVGIETPDANVLPDLLSAMKGEPDPSTRIQIVNAAVGIVNHHRLALPVEFVELLFDADPEIRALAAGYVSDAGSVPGLYGAPPVESLPMLLKALRHRDATVRSSALRVLSHLQVEQKTVLPEMRNALHDKAYSVRNNAVVAIWSMTKQAELVVPVLAALNGSDEPLGDRKEETMRALTKTFLCERTERMLKQEPDGVSTELIRCLHSSAEDVQRGAGRVLAAFLKGKDPTLAGQRRTVREQIERLSTDPNEQARSVAKAILESADKPEAMPRDEQPQ